MTWQEAIAQSPHRIAVRFSTPGDPPQLHEWRRYADGTADHRHDSRIQDARQSDVAGYTDWQPFVG